MNLSLNKSAVLLAALQLFAMSNAYASGVSPVEQAKRDRIRAYYGAALDGVKDINTQAQDEGLKGRLYEVLRKSHIVAPGKQDRLVESCKGVALAESESCVDVKALSYEGARQKMFGQLYLNQDSKGNYELWDVYCQKAWTQAELPKVGPNSIPDHNKINAEHTWPQSRFNANENRETQKTDLHHLYPTDSEMNRVRGNFQFGEVDDGKARKQRCDSNLLGPVIVPYGYSVSNNQSWYEVPDAHKGNVARSLMYFAVRYKAAMSPVEEYYMRVWNELDPVDARDQALNNEIQKIQGNRNPFIDYPHLIDLIPDFGSTSYKKIKGGSDGDEPSVPSKPQPREEPKKDDTAKPPGTPSTVKSSVRLEGDTFSIDGENGQPVLTLNGVVAACTNQNFGVSGAPFSTYEVFALEQSGTLHKIRGAPRREDKTEKIASGQDLVQVMAGRSVTCVPVSAAK